MIFNYPIKWRWIIICLRAWPKRGGSQAMRSFFYIVFLMPSNLRIRVQGNTPSSMWMGWSTCRTCHYGIKVSLTLISMVFLVVTIGKYFEGKVLQKNRAYDKADFHWELALQQHEGQLCRDKEQAAGRPLGEATGRLTSLEERCGQGGSLAVADRCDNHGRQREGSVERHEAARRSAKSFALASSKEWSCSA